MEDDVNMLIHSFNEHDFGSHACAAMVVDDELFTGEGSTPVAARTYLVEQVVGRHGLSIPGSAYPEELHGLVRFFCRRQIAQMRAQIRILDDVIAPLSLAQEDTVLLSMVDAPVDDVINALNQKEGS